MKKLPAWISLNLTDPEKSRGSESKESDSEMRVSTAALCKKITYIIWEKLQEDQNFENRQRELKRYLSNAETSAPAQANTNLYGKMLDRHDVKKEQKQIDAKKLKSIEVHEAPRQASQLILKI